MRSTELLAPAGGLDAGLVALHFGADAVYLGLKRFSARADADNFSLDELDAFVGHAHGLVPRRRVYVAVNTLVLDRELVDLVGVLGDLVDLGVDTAIVQDLGVLQLDGAVPPGTRRFQPRGRSRPAERVWLAGDDRRRILRPWGRTRLDSGVDATASCFAGCRPLIACVRRRR